MKPNMKLTKKNWNLQCFNSSITKQRTRGWVWAERQCSLTTGTSGLKIKWDNALEALSTMPGTHLVNAPQYWCSLAVFTVLRHWNGATCATAIYPFPVAFSWQHDRVARKHVSSLYYAFFFPCGFFLGNTGLYHYTFHVYNIIFQRLYVLQRAVFETELSLRGFTILCEICHWRRCCL